MGGKCSNQVDQCRRFPSTATRGQLPGRQWRAQTAKEALASHPHPGVFHFDRAATYCEGIEDVIVMLVVEGGAHIHREKKSELTRRGLGEADDPRRRVVVRR